MAAIGLLVVIFVIWVFISNSNSEAKKKEVLRINEQIKAGNLIRLSNGEVKDPRYLTSYEKTLLPDYQYLAEYGSKYGYGHTAHMSIEQLKEAAVKVRKKRTEEENEKGRLEYEKRKIENEQRILEIELKEKERHRIDRAEKWGRLSPVIKFQISESNVESKKKGIYVIHCVSDNRLYIGSSVNMLARKSQHITSLRNKKHHSYLMQEAFDELGENNFKFYVLRLIDNSDLFIIEGDKDEKEIERELKRKIKSVEQSFLDSYSPTFNIEDDARGKRHWEGSSKYSGSQRRY